MGRDAPARRALAEGGYTRIEQFTELIDAEVRKLHGATIYVTHRALVR